MLLLLIPDKRNVTSLRPSRKTVREPAAAEDLVLGRTLS